VLAALYNEASVNLSIIGSQKNGIVADSMFFEIDIGTAQFLINWTAPSHLPATSSRQSVASNLNVGQTVAPFDDRDVNTV
jgi:hypothetical protein